MKKFDYIFDPIMGKTVKKSLNRIRVVLAEKDRSNNWLAKELKVTPGTVSKWCGNKVQPSLETLAKIAEALEVDISELLNRTRNNQV